MGKISWIRQLSLAVALFVLGSFAFWLEYKQKPAQEAREEQAKKIFALKETPVEELKFMSQSRTFEIACLDAASKLCKPGDNSKWELKQPSRLRADDTNVNSLISSLNGLSATDTIDLKDETPEKRTALLKEYGLDAASRSSNQVKFISTKTSKGLATLYVGDAHPLGTGNFALLAQAGLQPDETKVYLIPPYFASNFDHDLTYWRDKKLLTISAHDIQSFVLESRKAGKISGSRKDTGWMIRSGKEELAGDLENIDSLLAGAQFLMAKSFTSDNKNDAKAKAALKGAQTILTLTLQKEKTAQDKELAPPITLKILGKPYAGRKEVYSSMYATASNLDPLFEIDANSKDRMNKTVKDLRLLKLITSIDRFTARKLSFSGKPLGTEPLVLTTADGAKWMDEKSKEEVNAEKVQTTLEKLSGNRIKDFLDLSKNASIASGQKEGIELSVADDKTPAKRRYVFWKNGAQLYARDLLSPRNEAFLVDNAVQDGLPWTPDFYKKVK